MYNYTTINNITEKTKTRLSLLMDLVNNDNLHQDILILTNKIIDCFNNGNKLIFCGNGGSAADCQHIVAEFIVKLSKIRKSLPAISLTCNNSIITAISNDMSFNYIFTRQLESLANPQDILIGISTSGNSINIIDAFKYAKKNSINTISITGCSNCQLIKLADDRIIIPSQNTQIVQEIYLMMFHIVCETLDQIYE